MPISPYTLNSLYNQGILDYMPYELCNSQNVSYMSSMQNPYLNSASKGSLYQKYGSQSDTFTAGVNTAAGVNDLGTGSIGSQSNAGTNAFGLEGIGSQSNAGMNAFGFGSIGSQSNAGTNAFGLEGIGSQSNAGSNAWGGFSDAEKKVSEGISGVTSFVNGVPNIVKGLVSAAIILGTFSLVFKTKKKVPAQQSGNPSKLNPINWFRKKKS